MSRKNGDAKKKTRSKRAVIGAVLIGIMILAFLVVKWATLPGLGLKNGEIINVRYHIPAGRYHIGDLIPVELQIRSTAGVRYERPDLAAAGLGKLELKREAAVRFAWRRGGRLETLRYDVTAWEVGKYKLPPLIMRYWLGTRSGAVRVSPINLQVESVLPAGKTDSELLKLDIKGIKGPLELPPRYPILWWSLGVLSLIILSVFLVKWIRSVWSRRETTGIGRDDNPEGMVEEPAHIVALRRLAILEAGNLPMKSYYSELSEISREYMERRFQTKALEMTTEEFLAVVAESGLLNREHQTMLSNFLKKADLVKFAKYVPPAKTVHDDLGSIRRLVEETAETMPETGEKTSEHEVSA